MQFICSILQMQYFNAAAFSKHKFYDLLVIISKEEAKNNIVVDDAAEHTA